MSALFHPLKVKKLVSETADAKSVYFDIPENLKSTFEYLPGQYLTLNVKINGEECRRAYSFSSSPITDSDPAVTIKKVDGGKFSTYVNEVLKEGDIIEVMPPMGKFTRITDLNAQNQYFMFAGGSGITPIMSIIKSVLKNEPKSIINLIYANRNKESIIFNDLLNKMHSENSDRLQIYHSLDQAEAGFSGNTGFLTANLIDSLVKQMAKAGYSPEFYICGPSPLMDLVKNTLAGMGIAQAKIHTEYFTTPTSSNKAETPTPAKVEENFDGNAVALIEFNGREYEVKIKKGTTILDAAKDADVDPPYACTMGVCTTCRARLIEGSAIMDEREGLSDSEIADGFILTCQAHPTSSKLVLRYE